MVTTAIGSSPAVDGVPARAPERPQEGWSVMIGIRPTTGRHEMLAVGAGAPTGGALEVAGGRARRRAVEGDETCPGPPPTEPRLRIEICVAPPETEVELDGRRTEDVTDVDDAADRDHCGNERAVRGPKAAAMGDDQPDPPGDGPREGDDAVGGGPHRRPGVRVESEAPVPGTVGARRLDERLDDRRVRWCRQAPWLVARRLQGGGGEGREQADPAHLPTPFRSRRRPTGAPAGAGPPWCGSGRPGSR